MRARPRPGFRLARPARIAMRRMLVVGLAVLPMASRGRKHGVDLRVRKHRGLRAIRPSSVLPATPNNRFSAALRPRPMRRGRRDRRPSARVQPACRAPHRPLGGTNPRRHRDDRVECLPERAFPVLGGARDHRVERPRLSSAAPLIEHGEMWRDRGLERKTLQQAFAETVDGMDLQAAARFQRQGEQPPRARRSLSSGAVLSAWRAPLEAWRPASSPKWRDPSAVGSASPPPPSWCRSGKECFRAAPRRAAAASSA